MEYYIFVHVHSLFFLMHLIIQLNNAVVNLSVEPNSLNLPTIASLKPELIKERNIIRNDLEKRISSHMDVYDSDKNRPSLLQEQHSIDNNQDSTAKTHRSRASIPTKVEPKDSTQRTKS